MQAFNKKAIREHILNQLAALSNEEKKSIELQQRKHLFTNSIWENARVIGITCSTSIEWDTKLIIKQAWEEKKTVALPKTIYEQSRMDFYKIDDFTELTVGYQGILEPSSNIDKLIEKQSIDLLIVPGVVFDQYGYRIGFGGGYYDRFLADFPNTTLSLLSTLQLVKTLPIEKHDIHVQYLITENGFEKVLAKK